MTSKLRFSGFIDTEARRLALANPGCAGAKMAAIIFKGRRILGYGFNSYKTHPLQARYGKNPSSIHMHAEIAAIVNASHTGLPEDIIGASILVLRIKNISGVNRLGLAKPCVGCMRALRAFGIRKLFYSDCSFDFKEMEL